MIKVSVFYPLKDGMSFDMRYYLEKHIPMVRQKLGSACKGIQIDQGLAGGGKGTPPTFTAMAHLLFDSVEAFEAAFGPHTAEIMGDIPNYTPIQPVIQVSDVKTS